MRRATLVANRSRLSLTQKRDRVVHLRLSGEEFAGLTTFAREHDLSTSEALRRLAREAGGLGPTFIGAEAGSVSANVTQLRKAGVNLNQIARALNAGKAPGYMDLKGGIERLGRIVAQQMDILEGMCGGRAGKHRRG